MHTELTKYAQKKLGKDYKVIPEGNEFSLVQYRADGTKGYLCTCSKTRMKKNIKFISRKINSLISEIQSLENDM